MVMQLQANWLIWFPCHEKSCTTFKWLCWYITSCNMQIKKMPIFPDYISDLATACFYRKHYLACGRKSILKQLNLIISNHLYHMGSPNRIHTWFCFPLLSKSVTHTSIENMSIIYHPRCITCGLVIAFRHVVW